MKAGKTVGKKKEYYEAGEPGSDSGDFGMNGADGFANESDGFTNEPDGFTNEPDGFSDGDVSGEDDYATNEEIMGMLEEHEGKNSPSIGTAVVVESSEDVMAIYLRDVLRFKVLSREEEVELARKVRQGDCEAMDLMINSNQRLVISIAYKKFGKRGLPVEDLVAAGNEGLRNAVLKFDPERGIRFATFAAFDIKKSMRRAIYEAADPIKLPESMHLMLARINEAADRLYRETGRRPTRKEIAAEVGVKESLVTTLLIHQAVQYVPLDTTVGDDNETLLVDRIAGERDSSAAEEAEEIIERHFRALDARERKIITGYYGLMGEPKQTLGELGKEFGLARQRISQIRIQAEKKLEANGFFEELKFVGTREA